jgi:hypothetical protein
MGDGAGARTLRLPADVGEDAGSFHDCRRRRAEEGSSAWDLGVERGVVAGSGRERRGHTQTEHKSVTVLWNCGGPSFLPRVASCLQNPPSESKAVPTLQHHLHQQHQHLQNREEVYHIQRAKKTLGYQR